VTTIFSRRGFLKLAGISGVLAVIPREIAHTQDFSGAPKQFTTTGQPIPELASFDNTVRDFMQARNIPGGTLAVTRKGKLVLARGYNYSSDTNFTIQPTSLFRIASLSKPITATAILRLCKDKRLTLTSKVADVLSLTPQAGQTPDPRLRSITVLNLLQHLGGWDRDKTFDPQFRDIIISKRIRVPLPITKENITTYMSGQPLQYDPGTTYVYSNYGYNLLGQIIAELSGQTYQDYVTQTILHPLKISKMRLGRTLYEYRLPDEVTYHTQYNSTTVFNNSGSQVPYPYGGFNLENMDSHGGWLASAVDMVRFASAFDNPSSNPVLDSSSETTMFSLPENITRSNYRPGDWYYGCGWLVRDWGGGVRNTWHDGSLEGTHSLLVRRHDALNWCVLFNQRDDPSGLSYDQIDDLLHPAADAVSKWPDHDLFNQYS